MEPDNRRSQRRVEASVPIRVRGQDATGEEFEDCVAALEVSRRGLSFLTPHPLPLFSTLSIVIPGRGSLLATEEDFLAEAAVLRCVNTEEGLFRVGVRFIGATLPVYSPETL